MPVTTSGHASPRMDVADTFWCLAVTQGQPRSVAGP